MKTYKAIKMTDKEIITCTDFDNEYHISSSKYNRLTIITKENLDKNNSLIDIINNIKLEFEIVIEVFHEENIKILEIANKNSKFVGLTIMCLTNGLIIKNILKDSYIKKLYLYIRCADINLDEILPYLNKIDNIKLCCCYLSGRYFKKILDSCLNVKNFHIGSNKFENNQIKYIAQFIRKTNTQNLIISYDGHGIFGEDNDWVTIIASLRVNKYIKNLKIDTDILTLNMLNVLCKILLYNKSIISIDTNPLLWDDVYYKVISQKLERNRQLLTKRNNEMENMGGMLMHSEVKINPIILQKFLQFCKNIPI